MARKGQHGQDILSAAEIGSYTVCPESWRLRTVLKITTGLRENIEEGLELHKKWAKNFDDSVVLFRGARLIAGLIILCILIYLLTGKGALP